MCLPVGSSDPVFGPLRRWKRTSKSSPKSGVALNHGSAYCAKRRPGKEERKPPACGAPVRGWTERRGWGCRTDLWLCAAASPKRCPLDRDALDSAPYHSLTAVVEIAMVHREAGERERVRYGACREPSASEDDRQHLLCLPHRAVSSLSPRLHRGS